MGLSTVLFGRVRDNWTFSYERSYADVSKVPDNNKEVSVSVANRYELLSQMRLFANGTSPDQARIDDLTRHIVRKWTPHATPVAKVYKWTVNEKRPLVGSGKRVTAVLAKAREKYETSTVRLFTEASRNVTMFRAGDGVAFIRRGRRQHGLLFAFGTCEEGDEEGAQKRHFAVVRVATRAADQDRCLGLHSIARTISVDVVFIALESILCPAVLWAWVNDTFLVLDVV